MGELSNEKLDEAIANGRAVRVLSIDQVDEAVRELVKFRNGEVVLLKATVEQLRDDNNELRVDIDNMLYEDDRNKLIHWGLRAGADPFDPELKCLPSTRTQIQQVQQIRGYACNAYEQVAKLEICKCGKGLAEHARQLV